jgi:predicted phosphohydrolase
MITTKQLSDLHLGHGHPGEYFNPGNGQILILAGDILCARHFKTDGYLKDIYTKFIDECSRNFERVIYVAGNHEFYGYNYEGTYKTLRENLPDNFHLLENETVKINDVNFIGFTLWTNFFNENPFEMMDAKGYMADYSTIRISNNYRKLNPEDTLKFHKTSIEYLKNELERLKNERVFVVSHHAPSHQCITPEFKNGKCNGSFCSDLDELILASPQIKNWAFGHVHSQHDFYIGGCRVTGNPRGYPHEHTRFDPNFEMEIL